MATFLVAHGAWTAAWGWKKMHPLLLAAGHRLVTPTLTGLGERAHLATPDIGLDTHIQDILGVLDCEDLRDVILIGHSYGGMVVTGVADRARGRIAQLVYLDAFVPQDGQSLFDLQSPETQVYFREQAKSGGGGWRIPPMAMPADTPPDDFAWSNPRRVPQPLKCFEQRLHLQNGPLTLPRSYIWCRLTAPHSFRRFFDRAHGEPGWRCYEIESSHNPHITTPDTLRDLLEMITARP
ncbi:MAG: alpha/beta fold hydrolase [Rhizobiales bacterium]|nr:alpha/beta fold hydrolase [Hyphomicrobiales bacterium]